MVIFLFGNHFHRSDLKYNIAIVIFPESDIFFNKCKHVVLKEHGYSSRIPSWVLNIVTEEFFSLLNRYIVVLASNPLSLVQLCRKVLSTNDPSVLINLFRSIEKQDLRECFIFVVQNSIVKRLYVITWRACFKYFQNIFFHSSLINYTVFDKNKSSLALLVSSTDLAEIMSS